MALYKANLLRSPVHVGNCIIILDHACGVLCVKLNCTLRFSDGVFGQGRYSNLLYEIKLRYLQWATLRR